MPQPGGAAASDTGAATAATGSRGDRRQSLWIRIVITLSYNLVELGRTAEAFALLDQAASAADSADQFALQASRGLIHLRIGDAAAAMSDLSSAIDGMHDRDLEDLARTLLNRGVLHMMAGDLPAAQADTTRAESAAAGADAGTVVFMARHNLGYLRFLAGDLPGSLQAMDEAQQLAPEQALGVPTLDRARVLLAAGLLGEARDYVDSAIGTFTRNRARADLTDALLVGADIAITGGEPPRARLLARRAARISVQRGNAAVELLARLAEQRAEAAARRAARRSGHPASATRCRAAAVAAEALAQELRDAGRNTEAAIATQLAVEGLLDAGDVSAADELFRTAGTASGALPLAGRLQAQLMAARIALSSGRRAEGVARLRRGLDDLGRFQALLGSQDLQTASAVWGRQLASAGLRAAVDTGSPAQILQWLERSRAASTRLPHIRPPADPALADDLGVLRIAEAAARSALLAGARDVGREREIAELRRRIRARTWTLGGAGTALRPPSLRSVQRLLADSAGAGAPTVLAYFHGAGQVHVLLITAGRARYLPLAPLGRCEELNRIVAADLDLLAADRVAAPLRAVAARSLSAALGELSERLVAPVLRAASGPVLVSGAGPLSAVPWPLLPALAGRSVTVTTSVSGSIAGLAPRPIAYRRGVLAVAGPEVVRAPDEVHAVVGCYPDARALTGAAATGSAVLGAIPAGGLLHIAAHGQHESHSPLFSSVVLADGPLYAYDIAPNGALPDQIVLSCCDVGRSAVRGDGEPLGLAVALLRSGVRTVVAAVAPVADRAAEAVMTGYHAALAAGRPPAAALAEALPLAGDAPAPFCCFGAGAGPGIADASAAPSGPAVAAAHGAVR